MSMARIRGLSKDKQSILLVLLPIIIATVVVAFRLVSPELLGYYADAYTVALLFTLFALSTLGWIIGKAK